MEKTKMNVEEQQNIAAEVLQSLSYHVDSDAVIAGGAPRNWDEGKLANDIDIYLRSNAVDTTKMIESMLSATLGFKVKQTQDAALVNYEFGTSFFIKRIFAFKHEDVLFQLMFIEPQEVWSKKDLPSKVMSHFDIGLNMIYYAWNKVYKTVEYIRDRDNNTLTLYKDNMTDAQLRHCMDKHLPKMQEYYPDYKLIIK